MDETWSLMAAGRYADAVVAAEKEFAALPRSVPLQHVVIASLLLGRYERAERTAEQLLAFDRGRLSCDFLLLGIARWLLGRQREALVQWIEADSAPYQDIAGGLNSLGIALFGATVIGDREAEAKVTRKLTRMAERANGGSVWPYPLARYLVGDLDDAALETALASASKIAPLLERYRCQADFYIAFRALQRGDLMLVQARLASAAKVTPALGILEPEYFLCRLWTGWDKPLG